jgi:hypothetical protein
VETVTPAGSDLAAGIPVVDYDISFRVRIGDPDDVASAVRDIFLSAYPNGDFTVIQRAFDDAARMYRGDDPGFHPCDTDYHDLRHILDVTLAVSRLLAGFERVHAGLPDALGEERVQMGIIGAIFHDIGYLRSVHDTRHKHGAEYTRTHVTRGTRFLARYLPEVGKGHWVGRMRQLLHYTGYEKVVQMRDPHDHMLGCLLGTGDLIAQMSDRSYLERCRDGLYEEFRIGRIPAPKSVDGRPFESAVELLNQTPGFMKMTVEGRLDKMFGSVYRYAEAFFGGDNPYMVGLEKNCRFLEMLLEEKKLHYLRRRTV